MREQKKEQKQEHKKEHKKEQKQAAAGMPSYGTLLVILLVAMVLAAWVAWLLLRQYVAPHPASHAQTSFRRMAPSLPAAYEASRRALLASITGMPSRMG
jgi:hypothetical protein